MMTAKEKKPIKRRSLWCGIILSVALVMLDGLENLTWNTKNENQPSKPENKETELVFIVTETGKIY
jgi:hypothetical protein